VIIREAKDTDRAALERIARESFTGAYALFAVRGLRRAKPLLVAEEERSLIGFLEGRAFRGRSSIGYVYFVAVDPRMRRRGIGRRLVGEALRRFEASGATHAFAAVTRDNESSQALFAASGFREAPRGALWRLFRWRAFRVRLRMVLAPHEVLLVRTFTDPSPASAQGA